MSTKTFIGGPWDGQRMEVHDGASDLWAPVPQRAVYPVYPDCHRISPSDTVELKKILYKRMLFAGEKHTLSVFVAESLTPDDVLRMLIYRYSK